MNTNKIINLIKDIKNGTFVRVAFTSTVPLKAKFKNTGIIIKKKTVTTGRVGVNYFNIKSVKDLPKTASRNYTNNYKWIIPNKIKYNTNTDNYYLSLATVPMYSNTYVTYEIINNGISKCISKKDLLNSEVATYIQDSYFNKNTNTPILTIKLENIEKLGSTIL